MRSRTSLAVPQVHADCSHELSSTCFVPYSAALYLADRVVHSGTFDAAMVQDLHVQLLPFERMADAVLATARQERYFDDPDLAEPLRWLEDCNEQVKDCMTALESILDPQLDEVMAAAMEEHRRSVSIPLDSAR